MTRKKVAPEPVGDILLFQTKDGRTRLEVQFKGDTTWLSQKQMAELFQKDVRTINEHVKNVFDEGELVEDSVIRNFRITAAEGESDAGWLKVKRESNQGMRNLFIAGKLPTKSNVQNLHIAFSVELAAFTLTAGLSNQVSME